MSATVKKMSYISEDSLRFDEEKKKFRMHNRPNDIFSYIFR